ncbi:type II toxin-antitoxin system RelE family toxin [Thioalkalivibrio sulfidiphilus]|uniref:type II toxin-antitoxin system RelE family toxin n=1 Tax=Thioalkalivibrio sulfidiphilus TaxID=1033854 RepID=UPI003BB1D7B4
MVWKIEFETSARKELGDLDGATARRIIRFLRYRVATSDNPRSLGKPLKGHLRDYWRYRIGDWGLVCHIDDIGVRILVIRVSHRKDVYR